MNKFKLTTFLCFLLPFLYWVYLFFNSSIEVKFDAEAYEMLGRIIHTQGFEAFFNEPPDKVGLYPLLISFSMRIADIFHVPYQTIQKIFQIALLLVSQILLFRILILLKVRLLVVNCVILYWGFSPAIVNSTFSLYSEILSYPFILGIFLCSYYGWANIIEGNYKRIALFAVSLAALFTGLSLTRAIYEYVMILYLAGLFALLLIFLFKKRSKLFLNGVLFIFITFISASFLFYPYKILNYKHNGYKSLTFVGFQSLYENVEARTKPLTSTHLLSYIATIPGDKICDKIFGEKECLSWNVYLTSLGKLKELQSQGLSSEEIDHQFKSWAIAGVLNHPFQYSFLTSLQSLKLFFWESTKVGYVTYPAWLLNIFDSVILKNALRLVVFLITFYSLGYSIRLLWRGRAQLLNPSSEHHLFYFGLLIIFFLIFMTIILYAPYIVVTRYAFSIVPLYLILIGMTFDKKKQLQNYSRVYSTTKEGL